MQWSRLALLVSLVIPALTAHAGDDAIRESRRLQSEAREAYKARDFATFLERIEGASDLRPSHPTLLYYVAGALTLNGRHEEALDVLERIASMGMVYSPEKEPDFEALTRLSRFPGITNAFQRNAAAQGTPSTAARFATAGVIPEGLARDEKAGVFYLSSVRKGAIWRVAKEGATPLVENHPLAILGLALDSKGHVLWAVASGLVQREGLVSADRDRAELLAIDTRSGKILRKLAPPGDGRHLLGDVAISPRGEVVVSDSVANEIYRVSGSTLEPFARGAFTSLQGLTWSADGSTLFVSDYSQGLFAIDAKSRDAKLLAVPAEVSLLGLDGIYAAGPRQIIGIQNGTNPNRVIRIDLGSEGVRAVTTIAANHPSMTGPTLGALGRKRFYFIGNGEWELFDDKGALRDGAKPSAAVIFEVPLQ